MNTDDLIARLAETGAQVDRPMAQGRFWGPLAAAAIVSLLLMWSVLEPRADWRDAIALPMFWGKLAFTAGVAVAATVLLRRLGRPGDRTRAPAVGVALPLALVWLMAAVVLAAAPAGQRVALVMGSTWLQCVAIIPALSVPAFALCVVAVRSLAPTRLALGGAVAGLVAGSVAAFAYALHCTEMQAPFLAVWYVIGMLVPAATGALLGPRLLRW